MSYKLQVTNLSKNFGRQRILKQVSFQINEGSFNLISGKNGAGKSTLLDVLTGATSKNSGKIEFEGIDIDSNKSYFQKNFSYCSQSLFFYQDLDLYKNIVFFAQLKNNPEFDIEEINTLVESFGLSRYSGIPLKRFSTGMKKKTALCMALSQGTSLMIFDEPYASLDQESVDILNTVMIRMHNQGTTFILTSHQDLIPTSVEHSIFVLQDGILNRQELV